jgi:transposase InsO family protein
MSMTHEPYQRKSKVSKVQSLTARRRSDRARRQRQRASEQAARRRERQFRFRVRVVRCYRQLRAQLSERAAVERTLAHWQPREAHHFPLCAASIRQWHRRVGRADWTALYPRSQRPHTQPQAVDATTVSLIYTLRRVKGWGGHHIAAELRQRGLATVSGSTVYAVLRRLNLPIKAYALRGRYDGIAYQRYEKARPHDQWHLDWTQVVVGEGQTLYVWVMLDDYSRLVLGAEATLTLSSQWACAWVSTQVTRAGCPAEIVTDNSTLFVSPWLQSHSRFHQHLSTLGIAQRTIAPFYPQGNGKIEAWMATLRREVLDRRTFETQAELQAALDAFVRYYNHYRLHSALGWQPPITRYAGRRLSITGLGGLLGLEGMAADARWGVSECDPPIAITPFTAQNAFALACRS